MPSALGGAEYEISQMGFAVDGQTLPSPRVKLRVCVCVCGGGGEKGGSNLSTGSRTYKLEETSKPAGYHVCCMTAEDRPVSLPILQSARAGRV